MSINFVCNFNDNKKKITHAILTQQRPYKSINDPSTVLAGTM